MLSMHYGYCVNVGSKVVKFDKFLHINHSAMLSMQPLCQLNKQMELADKLNSQSLKTSANWQDI